MKVVAGSWEGFAFAWVLDPDSKSVGNVICKVSCCHQSVVGVYITGMEGVLHLQLLPVEVLREGG